MLCIQKLKKRILNACDFFSLLVSVDETSFVILFGGVENSSNLYVSLFTITKTFVATYGKKQF